MTRRSPAVFVWLLACLLPKAGFGQVAAPGYTVTNFATGFVNCFGSIGGVGPIGIAFDAGGNLFVGDYCTGFLYRFGPAGGAASSGTQLNATSLGPSIAGLAFTKDGRLYLARQGPGDVVEIDPSNGTMLRTVAFVVNATGLATDPISGDLFLSQACSCANTIFRISNFESGPGNVTAYAAVAADGIAFGLDGTLYAASGNSVEAIAGTNSPSPGAVTVLPVSVPSIDGLAVSADPFTPFLYGNRNSGIITKVAQTTSPPTLTDIVTGGTRGDFAAVGFDGCLYATQTDRILKVTNADGTCLPAPLGPLGPTSPPSCLIPSSSETISNTAWNQFNIPSGTSSVVWVHAQFKHISGIPKTTKSTVLFTGVSFVLNGKVYPMPNGSVVFDPAAPSISTTTWGVGTWTTTINPNLISDENFFTGAAIPVDVSIAAGGQATIQFTTSSNVKPISFQWQWSAAAYTYWPTNWNQAGIQPYHGDGLHADTPTNVQVQQSLIQGPRGGGGSNFTGSWSATGQSGPCR